MEGKRSTRPYQPDLHLQHLRKHDLWPKPVPPQWSHLHRGRQQFQAQNTLIYPYYSDSHHRMFREITGAIDRSRSPISYV